MNTSSDTFTKKGTLASWVPAYMEATRSICASIRRPAIGADRMCNMDDVLYRHLRRIISSATIIRDIGEYKEVVVEWTKNPTKNIEVSRISAEIEELEKALETKEEELTDMLGS